jgi:hypothetical protein
MFEGGEWWIPPEQVNVDDDDVRSDPGEEEERQATRVKGFLGQRGQKKFLWLLRGVDSRRGSVARGMAYVMDRSDAAEEVLVPLDPTDFRLWISLLRVYVLLKLLYPRRSQDYISSVIFYTILPVVVATFGNTGNCISIDDGD